VVLDRDGAMKLVMILAALAALGLAAAIAVSGPGVRFGWWEYDFGLGLIRKAALPVLVAAGATGILFIVSLFMARGLAPLVLIAALAAGAAGMIPIKMKQLFEGNPFIHDVTTDFADPPEIVAAAALPRKNPPEYLGDEMTPRADKTTAQAQQEAFPDIGPVVIDASVDASAEIIRGIVTGMGMEILDAGPIDNGWRIEAADTSQWFGFVDDFVVRLRPEGARTRIDARSKSRIGSSDLGANAKRIRAFYERLDAVS